MKPLFARLTCTTDGHSKAYEVALTRFNDGGETKFVVNAKYGAIGSRLKDAPITTEPVDYETAVKLFEAKVREKETGKSHYVREDGESSQDDSPKLEDTGFRPRLVIHVDDEDPMEYITNDNWYLTKKWDGERQALYITPTEVYGANRLGQRTVLPKALVEDAQGWRKANGGGCMLDGELIPGPKYLIFDVLEVNFSVLDRASYEERVALMETFRDFRSIRVAPVKKTAEAKLAYYHECENGEGVVFTYAHSSYKPGVSEQCVAIKFWHDASCIVLKHNTANSIAIGMKDGKDIKPVGNVTMTGKIRPPVGSICKVRYLYAVSSLYQPTFIRIETDRTEPDTWESVHKKEKP